MIVGFYRDESKIKAAPVMSHECSRMVLLMVRFCSPDDGSGSRVDTGCALCWVFGSDHGKDYINTPFGGQKEAFKYQKPEVEGPVKR